MGRFAQPDTIIPDPYNPLTIDRFAYARNNPIRYNDPTGHDVGCPGYSASFCGIPTKIGPVIPPTIIPTPSPTRRLSQNREVTGTQNPTRGKSPVTTATPSSTKTFIEKTPGIATDIPISEVPLPPGISYSYNVLQWDPSGVNWGEVGLDAIGITGDVIPLFEVPATALEVIDVVSKFSNAIELTSDALDFANSYPNLNQMDLPNTALDVLSLIPGFGAVSSGAGILYNFSTGFYTETRYGP